TNDTATDAPESAFDADGATTGFLAANSGSASFSGTDISLENTLSSDVSLQDHIAAQVNLLPLSAADTIIAAFLTDMLSETGYLTGDIGEIAESLGCPPGRVEEVLSQLRGLDPTGVFARDLADCLALQLQEKNRYDPAMAALLDNLEMLAAGNLRGLLEVCGVDQEDLAEMIAELRALDPKPGLKYGGEVAQTVVPDVFVRRRPDGGWHVELNSETLPKVLVNNRYYSVIAKKSKHREEKEFLSECLNSANWLVKSLDQRAQTILKVATEIVRQQDGFLRYGVSHLKPLNLRAVAEAIEMHESTVSRVTSNKTMATPRGIFGMKYFFTASIAATDGGEAFSAESIRHRIKALIDGEAADDILSDDKIVEILAGKGVDIARRTVAKYREAMNIPSSVERRRLKRAGFLKAG